MTKPRKLIESFVPSSYELDIRPSGNHAIGNVTILGSKVGRPSKRLTLHQRGLKITSAKLTVMDKKEPRDIPLSRLNLHQKFEEVRLHADQLLFPGQYKIELEFESSTLDYREQLEKLSSGEPAGSFRHIFPLIDESGAKASYNVRHANQD